MGADVGKGGGVPKDREGGGRFEEVRGGVVRDCALAEPVSTALCEPHDGEVHAAAGREGRGAEPLSDGGGRDEVGEGDGASGGREGAEQHAEGDILLCRSAGTIGVSVWIPSIDRRRSASPKGSICGF